MQTLEMCEGGLLKIRPGNDIIQSVFPFECNNGVLPLCLLVIYSIIEFVGLLDAYTIIAIDKQIPRANKADH